MKIISLLLILFLNLFGFNIDDYEEFYGGKYDIENMELQKLVITPSEDGYLTITTSMVPYCKVQVFNNRNKFITELNILNGYRGEIKVKAEKNYLIWILPKNKHCKYVLINFP